MAEMDDKQSDYFKSVNISMRLSDIRDLEDYIYNQKKTIKKDSPINKSLVIRIALRRLYEIDKPFDELSSTKKASP